MQYMKKYKPGGLVGGQVNLDKNKDGKISGLDFKMMMSGGKMNYMGGGRYAGASVDDGSTGRGYEQGGKMNESPFYQDGGMTPGGSDVQKLLEMLSNYDQNAPIGEFLNVLMEMGGQGGAGEAAAAGAGAMAGSMGAGAGEAAMRNLPPRDVESLLRQLGQQGGKPFVSFPAE